MRSGDGIGRRRQLELRYLTRDGLFQMVTDDAVVPLSLRVDRADGEPMERPTRVLCGSQPQTCFPAASMLLVGTRQAKRSSKLYHFM